MTTAKTRTREQPAALRDHALHLLHEMVRIRRLV